MISLTEKNIADIMTKITEELVFENLKSYQIALIDWAKEEILENFYHEI